MSVLLGAAGVGTASFLHLVFRKGIWVLKDPPRLSVGINDQLVNSTACRQQSTHDLRPTASGSGSGSVGQSY